MAEPVWYFPAPNVAVYKTPGDVNNQGKYAFFDMDWTLIRPVRGEFPRDANDFEILPERKRSLQHLLDQGYSLIIITNQRGRNAADREMALKRIEKFVQELGLPIVVLVAQGQDVFRKPQIGLWQVFRQMFQIPDGTNIEAFYVGDAAGRPQDFDNVDIEWAKNVGIPFSTPENFFPKQLPPIPDIPTGANPKTMIVLVGEMGSGKTTFYEQYLKPKGYVHVSQDILKTKPQVFKTLEDTLKHSQPVVVDRTNPSQEDRQQFYDLAKKYGYDVMVLYFVRNGHGWNKLREKNPYPKGPVPKIAYNQYYSKLEPPTERNTPSPVYQIWW